MPHAAPNKLSKNYLKKSQNLKQKTELVKIKTISI